MGSSVSTHSVKMESHDRNKYAGFVSTDSWKKIVRNKDATLSGQLEQKLIKIERDRIQHPAKVVKEFRLYPADSAKPIWMKKIRNKETKSYWVIDTERNASATEFPTAPPQSLTISKKARYYSENKKTKRKESGIITGAQNSKPGKKELEAQDGLRRISIKAPPRRFNVIDSSEEEDSFPSTNRRLAAIPLSDTELHKISSNSSPQTSSLPLVGGITGGVISTALVCLACLLKRRFQKLKNTFETGDQTLDRWPLNAAELSV